MSDDRPAPWWFSGDEAPADASEPGDASEAGDASTSGMDWTVLLSGAQRVMDWATEKVMAPHADHDVPADHPECVVCRTLTVVAAPGFGSSSAAADGPATATPIVWIPVRGEDAPPTGQG